MKSLISILLALIASISLGYKLGNVFFSEDIAFGYFGNLRNTIKENGVHTLRLKMTYFLDWNRLKKYKY